MHPCGQRNKHLLLVTNRTGFQTTKNSSQINSSPWLKSKSCHCKVWTPHLLANLSLSLCNTLTCLTEQQLVSSLNLWPLSDWSDSGQRLNRTSPLLRHYDTPGLSKSTHCDSRQVSSTFCSEYYRFPVKWKFRAYTVYVVIKDLIASLFRWACQRVLAANCAALWLLLCGFPSTSAG